MTTHSKIKLYVYPDIRHCQTPHFAGARLTRTTASGTVTAHAKDAA